MKHARIKKVLNWFEVRLQTKPTYAVTAGHLVPRNAKWWYVFGSATLMFFSIQILTGICLAFVYVPSADKAYASLEHINFVQPFGWELRAIHTWSAHFMVLMMLIHMIQVFLMGVFKYPRELTWIVGIFLFALTLGMAFTGQVLRWDQDAYWGLGIGAAMVGRVPFIGPNLVNLMLGGPILAGEALSRFFALHVFIMPALLIGIIVVHLRLVLKCGISEMPKAGELVDKETYIEEYEGRIKKRGIPYFPNAAAPDLIFNGFALFLMLGCAFIFGPDGPSGVPDPTLINTVPRPDFWFLWIFAILALLPPHMETSLILISPFVIFAILIGLPFMTGTGERTPTRRPVAVLTVILVIVVLAALTRLAQTSPWSPHMNAWSEDVTPESFLRGRTPLEMQGALMIQYAQCRNCHSLDGIGGKRGPRLDNVSTRLSPNQLIRQVLQGGGNMPAYGHKLSPEKVDALVAFLKTTHPSDEAPASIPLPPGAAE